MIKIYLIRHGATKGNTEGRYVGWTDEEILDESVKTLRILRLNRRDLFDDVHVDAVYSSPMKRCIHTAEILFEGTGSPVIIADALKECSFGEFEYMNYRELNGNPDYQRYIDSGGNTAFPGGESRADFQKRCVQAFKDIIQECTVNGHDMTVAIVAHGGTIMSILDAFALPHRDYFDWNCRNAEGYVAEYSDNSLKITENIQYRNDT